MLLFIILLIGLIFIFPYIPLVLYSFSNTWKYPNIFPSNLSLKWWKYVFKQPITYKAIFYSLIIAIIVSLINLIIGLPAANALVKDKFKGRKFFEHSMFAPIIIPPIISVMGIHFIFIKLNLVENFIGVILIHIIPTFPYMLRTLILGYKNFDFNYEKVAILYGASSLKKYLLITLPMLMPSILSGIILSLLISFSNYILTYIIGGGKIITLPLITFPYIVGGNRAIGAVYVIIFIVLNIISVIFIEKIFGKLYKK
ncbi:putative spermidine/putrescine transport system permease protein [Hypnocyclicus thermotrophus]|uniref:Spermidine/putrescine transport system permease protein n=1 Tax=Hypnocyclicus thermotrophus TaxID=1627895 RepID=A0AA46I6S7_9FUSO|nr:ABC transporter permease subunit [Hypnocyclicus thermotrophus]TDT72597.1 putative spermidine/putrescine transport system permease protein [Hypnocyclicus thermotrophus]